MPIRKSYQITLAAYIFVIFPVKYANSLGMTPDANVSKEIDIIRLILLLQEVAYESSPSHDRLCSAARRLLIRI